jgi:hypothetical protein
MKRINYGPKGQVYEAPMADVVEIESQGVLCASGGGDEPTQEGASGSTEGIHFGTTYGSWG